MEITKHVSDETGRDADLNELIVDFEYRIAHGDRLVLPELKAKRVLGFLRALSAAPVTQEPVAWLPIDTRPLKTGRYLVGHRGWQEVMHYFGPEKEWVPGTRLGFHRLEKRGWIWCDPRVAFGATHCMPITVPSEDGTTPPAPAASVGAEEIARVAGILFDHPAFKFRYISLAARKDASNELAISLLSRAEGE